MANELTRTGYGQVEPNHLSAMRTGQIYAQLPATGTITSLENGQFVKYNYASGVVDFGGKGEWLLVMNEVKLYEPRLFAKDFRMASGDYVDQEMVPRCYKTNIGDIITTNAVTQNAAGVKVVGALLSPNTSTGFLDIVTSPSAGQLLWQVVKVTTMPDGQSAVKIMRVGNGYMSASGGTISY